MNSVVIKRTVAKACFFCLCAEILEALSSLPAMTTLFTTSTVSATDSIQFSGSTTMYHMSTVSSVKYTTLPLQSE